MNNKRMKFENPIRLEELKPEATLKRIGLQEDHVLCDIGAGSGIFTIPAARITKNKVYALEINEEMLSVIGEKAKSEGITNIELIKVKGDHFDLIDHSIDVVLLVTILHEIQNTTVFLEKVKTILKDNGKIVVIEFHKRETPMGPPIGHRMGKDDMIDGFKKIDFIISEEFNLGENFYCSVFQYLNSF